MPYVFSFDATPRSEGVPKTATTLVLYLESDFRRVALRLGETALVVRLLHDLDNRSPEHVLVGERQRGAEPKHLHTWLPLGVWVEKKGEKGRGSREA